MLNFFKKSKGAVLGLDIGTSAIKMVELSPSGGAPKLTRWAIHPLPQGAIRENTIANVDAVIDVFARAITREAIKAKRVVSAVCSSHAISSSLDMPGDLSESEMEDQVEIEATQFVPYALDDVNLDFEVVGPSGLNPDDYEVLAVACRREIVEDYVAVIEAAELEPEIIDIDTYALERVTTMSHPGPGMKAVVDIGQGNTHLGIFDQNKTLYSRYQPFGGKQLNDLVVQRYGVSEEEAEGLIKSDSPPDGYRREVMPQFVELAAKEVSRALQFFYSSSSHSSVDQLLIAGGSAQADGVVEAIEKETGIPAAPLDVFAKINHRFDSQRLAQVAGSLAVACGLALRGLHDGD